MISQSYTPKQHYVGENVFCFSAKFCKIAFNKLHLLHQDQTQASKIWQTYFCGLSSKRKFFLPDELFIELSAQILKCYYLKKICPALWLAPLPPLSSLRHFSIFILMSNSIIITQPLSTRDL